MRSVSEYLAKAREFDQLAGDAAHPSLRKRYEDLADCYRLLAEERRRLIAEHVIEPD